MASLKRKAVDDEERANQPSSSFPSPPTADNQKKARPSQRKRRRRSTAASQSAKSPSSNIDSAGSSIMTVSNADLETTLANALPEFDASEYIWSYHHMPSYLIKYWHQRYSFFSKFDEGVMFDEEGWYSITPEKLAIHIAERCSVDTIVDAFCGVGGNSIQFANLCKKVIAVDIDPVKIRCAQHNARVYGVEDKIQFVLGDFMELASTLKADAVFLSPPWGGPSYLTAEMFDMYSMMPMNGGDLFNRARSISNNICYYMPRNIALDQLIQIAGPGSTCEIEQAFLNGRHKCCVAYYGSFVNKQAAQPVEDGSNETLPPAAQNGDDGNALHGGSGNESEQTTDSKPVQPTISASPVPQTAQANMLQVGARDEMVSPPESSTKVDKRQESATSTHPELPTELELADQVRHIFSQAGDDLASVTHNGVRKRLEAHFGMNLQPVKHVINRLIDGTFQN
ncbi:Trimethylguanosine synthase [Rhizophlyctis rosea]|uniref:Trimethylguanosine synthase n=1 Tax=Rhizophlyctis rosea TaxID=64517 RepID=A0AAD5X8L0_9FUNG|nr:Trimethylguanosine synthase [Rhizophlyctis rosea]